MNVRHRFNTFASNVAYLNLLEVWTVYQHLLGVKGVNPGGGGGYILYITAILPILRHAIKRLYKNNRKQSKRSSSFHHDTSTKKVAENVMHSEWAFSLLLFHLCIFPKDFNYERSMLNIFSNHERTKNVCTKQMAPKVETICLLHA